MKRYIFYLFTFLPFLSLLSCHKNNNTSILVDDKSYIRNFELTQTNPSNDSVIRIFSPKAIINPQNNDIEIIDSSIDILNNNSQDINIKSGNAFPFGKVFLFKDLFSVSLGGGGGFGL